MKNNFELAPFSRSSMAFHRKPLGVYHEPVYTLKECAVKFEISNFKLAGLMRKHPDGVPQPVTDLLPNRKLYSFKKMKAWYDAIPTGEPK